METIQKLRALAKERASYAYSPYSHAKVGAALMTEDGSFFSGCNIENSSYGGTICAERVAIFNAVALGHKKIKKLYVYSEAGWPPCGMCRQVMAEFASPELEIIIGDANGEKEIISFDKLFPLAFTPKHLE